MFHHVILPHKTVDITVTPITLADLQRARHAVLHFRTRAVPKTLWTGPMDEKGRDN